MGIRVVPFTALNPATKAAVPDALFVEMDAEDSYRLLMKDLWARGEAFTLVEHDVVPTAEQVAELEACPYPWCHFGYCPGDWVPTFGCARFSRNLIAGTQGVWDDESWPWSQLDAKFAVYARALGWEHHWHYPHVLHTRFSVINRDGNESRIEPHHDLELAILNAEKVSLEALVRSRR